MDVLDQSIVEGQEEHRPVKRRWTWFEKIAPAGFIALVLWREAFSSLWAYDWIEYYALALASAYFLGYYWIAKPEVRTVRTVIMTILYGIFFSTGIILFVFWTLALLQSEYQEIVLGYLVFFMLILILDVLLAWGKTIVINFHMLVRGVVLGTMLAFMYLVPENVHVAFTYRKYPDFVAYYKEHLNDGEFLEVWSKYYETHPYPGKDK